MLKFWMKTALKTTKISPSQPISIPAACITRMPQPNREYSNVQSQASKALTNVDYLANININNNPRNIIYTGIVCTIGPASQSPGMLLTMMENGMTVTRLNCSHKNDEFFLQTIANVRRATSMYKEKHGVDVHIAIALDTKRPEIRTGVLKDDIQELDLTTGNSVIITTEESHKESCTDEIIWVDYKNFTKVLEPGKIIYIDDGLISIKVVEVEQDKINCIIVNGGKLGSKKSCNLPGTDTGLPAVSEKDKEDLTFGLEHAVDVVFASFIRDAAGVRAIRNFLGKKGEHIWIISKIENQQGLDNIDEIIEESDGIMVARGDLGTEISLEKVFVAQKQIIAKCNKAAKPVITATQMLESMVEKHRCTLADASDVGNAVLDGTDCVMLSSETTYGNYPEVSVKTMATVAKKAEVCFWNKQFFADLLISEFNAVDTGLAATSAVASSAVLASHLNHAKAIVVVVASIHGVKQISKLRPTCPILAVTDVPMVARQLQLCRGVVPVVCMDEKNAHYAALEVANNRKITSPGDTIITITEEKQASTVTVEKIAALIKDKVIYQL